MANSDRRYFDRNGKQFIPMTVDGTNYDDAFMTTPKIFTLAGIFVSLFLIIAYLNASYASTRAYTVLLGVWFILSFYATRFIIFEEKFYYKMYKARKGNEVTTPAITWNISSIKDTSDGAILTYADAKIGVIVKVERDTIVGKDENFEELHYDCISDFLKDLNKKKYNHVHLDVMETAGNDPRLETLDKLPIHCTNPNIKVLVEQQIGFIKKIEQNSLYESDYYLIWSNDITKLDSILSDVIDSVMILLSGGFKEYIILSKKELIELKKLLSGVNYFDATEASLNVYKDSGYGYSKPFDIVGIKWNNGEIQKLNDRDKSILSSEAKKFEDYSDLELVDVDLYSKIYREDNSNVDFDQLLNIDNPIKNNNQPTENINFDEINLRDFMGNNNSTIVDEVDIDFFDDDDDEDTVYF